MYKTNWGDELNTMATKLLMDKAKKEKADEFYTQRSDIENEMWYYKEQFKDKVIFCNCDDPYESNFFKYFALNFNHLGLKKPIATCYDSSTSPLLNCRCLIAANQFLTKTEEPIR